MPKNHGLFKKIAPPVPATCLFGINRVFYIIAHAGFHKGNDERLREVRKLYEHPARGANVALLERRALARVSTRL